MAINKIILNGVTQIDLTQNKNNFRSKFFLAPIFFGHFTKK